MGKVYYIKGFKGHYPVGTAAVVVANDRVEAVNLLVIEARKHGLTLDLKDLNPTDFVQLDTVMPHCVILNDGDY